MNGTEYAANLRKLADFIDSKRVLDAMYFGVNTTYVSVDADEIKQAARGGGWRKVYDDNHLTLHHEIDGLELQVFTARDGVCTPKATEEVVEEVADEAWIREQIKLVRAHAPKVTVTRQVVTEWDCPPLLGLSK